MDNLVLEHLRAIRSDIAIIKEDSKEIKSRLTTLEIGQATLLQHIGHMSGDIAEQHGRYDRLVDRIEKIEKRLEISD
jgi:uncharacterized coiled-coil protein SlyX